MFDVLLSILILLAAITLIYFVVLPLALWWRDRRAPYDNPLIVKRSEIKLGERIKVDGCASRFTRIEIIEDK